MYCSVVLLTKRYPALVDKINHKSSRKSLIILFFESQSTNFDALENLKTTSGSHATSNRSTDRPSRQFICLSEFKVVIATPSHDCLISRGIPVLLRLAYRLTDVTTFHQRFTNKLKRCPCSDGQWILQFKSR